jgi:hypothetical protein
VTNETSSFQQHQSNPAEASASLTINEYGLSQIRDTKSFASFNASELMPPVSGILSTAKSPASGPAISITPQTRLHYGGTEIDVATAVTLGLIQRDTSGNYTETASGRSDDYRATLTPEQQNPHQDAQGGPEAVPFDPTTEAFVTGWGGQIHPSIQNAAMVQVIEKGLDALDGRLASGTDFDQDTFKAGVGKVAKAFEDQFDSLAARKGIDAEEFRMWVRENHPQEIKDAMRFHATTRNLSAYEPLMQRYLASVPPTMEALQARGFPVMVDPRGGPMVCIEGQWMQIPVAAKIGLV